MAAQAGRILGFRVAVKELNMGGCQNYGPFWGTTLNITCRTIMGIQKGTIILITTHISYHTRRTGLIVMYTHFGDLV